MTAAKLFSVELCYLATIAFHLYQLQTTPTKSAGPASFAHLLQLQVSPVYADWHQGGATHVLGIELLAIACEVRRRADGPRHACIKVRDN